MKSWMNRRVLAALVLVIGLGLGGLLVARRLGVFDKVPVICPGDPNLPTIGAWSSGAAMPTIRAETAASDIDGRIYVAGGMVKQWLTTTTLEIYDTASDSWTSGAPMPYGIHHAGVTTANGRLYVIGGYDDMGKMVNARPDIADTWYYDPEQDKWFAVADMPSPRAAHAAVTLDGLIYVVAGTGTGAQDVWVYDPVADTWDASRQGKLPTPREHVPAIVVDGKIWVIGGRWKDISTGAVEVYDPVSDTWERKADMPVPRSALALAVFDGRIYAAGGEDLGTYCTYGTIHVYDIASDTWTGMKDMPSPRHAMLSAVVNNRWYLIGGSSGANGATERDLTGIVEIFTPNAAS